MIEKVISVPKENRFSKSVYLYKNYGFKEIGFYPECVAPKEL